LIDEESKPTPLANEWRFNEKYPEVCAKIKSSIYDQELLDAFPDVNHDKAQVERWFASKTMSGAVAARRMATLFELLTKAEPNQKETKDQNKAIQKNQQNSRPKISPTAKPKVEINRPESSPVITLPQNNQQFPSIHIDVQIHLSPEAPPEQIDKIFESIAKHLNSLYTRNNNTELS
jgi:hypothetical protein